MSPLVVAWWAALLVAGAIDRIVLLWPAATTLDGIRAASQVTLVVDLLGVAVALLALFLVRAAHDRIAGLARRRAVPVAAPVVGSAS